MLGLYTKKDIERLLVAGGSSLPDIVKSAQSRVVNTINTTTIAIQRSQDIIAKAQNAIAIDTEVLSEARATERLLALLGM